VGYDELTQMWWVGFTKTGATTPWVVAFVTANKGGNGIQDLDPYAVATPPKVPNPLPSAPQAFANYFQHLDTTGDLGKSLPTSYGDTTIMDTEVQVSSNLYQQRKAEGLNLQISHQVDQVSPVFPQFVSGSPYGATECFAVSMTVIVTSTTGSAVIQPPDRSAWGPEIAPGYYKQLNLSYEDEEWVAENSGGLISLNAEEGGLYSFSAIPA
jgi:hypothetical protein